MNAYSPRLPSTPVAAWTGTLSPHSLPRPPSHPDLGFTRLGLAGPCPGPSQILHTTLGQSCQPREAKCSFHHTRPHPQAGSQPFVWKKKRTAGIDKFKFCPPCPPAPHRLPSSSFSKHRLTNSASSKGGKTLNLLHLSPSLPSSSYTNQGTAGPLSLRRSSAHPKVKFPFSSRQLRQPGLGCHPLSGLLRAHSTQLSPAQFPQALVPLLTFLLLAPQVPQPHLTLPSFSSVSCILV